MKLHFEPNLDYQHQAIDAVCDLFRGQELCRSEFTVTRSSSGGDHLAGFGSELGIGNRLTLLDDQLLKNLHEVQLRNGVSPSSSLDSGDFTVEMETGTGKTYVYLRTIYELNKRYGFTKFVIVVPSVAIKEGVYKSLQITEEHFRSLFAGVPVNFFLYDSSKPGPVRSFATSTDIQIMVVTVGAINKKDVNNLYKESEKTGGDKPIDLIKATRPIIIVDEPQSVDGGLEGRGKEALGAMNPLCTLRYSATHADKHHMVYRLDAVDAYERKLVKQIEVAAASVEGGQNKPYVKLISVSNKRGVISAKVEIDVQAGPSVQRREVIVQDGDSLEETTGRALYKNHQIGTINTALGKKSMELRFPGGEAFLSEGDAHADVDVLSVQREMIKRTIKEHLEKELRLASQGIKVLSLFFIDSVDKYRIYDADGNPQKGIYAQIFEEEYRRFTRNPEYQSLFKDVDLTTEAEAVHEGYFSIDKRGGWTNTEDNNQANRENAERAYNLIMKDKEKLLSFSTKLKFIFSHSALKEGWDNPNVFQICNLRDMGSERERRQTIGRGLRLCVNQKGERIRGFEINTLTVIANESYQDFAEKLQKEIEDETGIRFGIVEKHQFAGIEIRNAEGNPAPLGFEQSEKLWALLKAEGLINEQGKVQDKLRESIREGTFTLPEPFTGQIDQIKEILRKLAGRLEVKNADERKTVRTRQAVLDSEEFKALWDRIKQKTTYRVEFDNEALITKSIEALKDAPAITKTRLQWRKAEVLIGRSGVETEEQSSSATVTLNEDDIEIPDVLTDLQDKTQLTRKSIFRILKESERLNDLKRNPQQFIEIASEVINRTKRLVIVDGIKYHRLGESDIYAQSLFQAEELSGYLKSMVESKKSVYEQVIYQSDTEKTFAEELEKNEDIKVYAKLPAWFQVPTPLGTYNPDWALLLLNDGTEQLYFVVETKSSLFTDELREKEKAKIKCGIAHFAELANHTSNPAKFIKARNLGDVLTVD